MSGAYENKGAMAATIVVAASDSLNKAAANYVCPGAADNVVIQAAIDALPAGGGKVVLLEGTYNLAVTIELNINVTLEGSGWNTILRLSNSAIPYYVGVEHQSVIEVDPTFTGGVATGIRIANLALYGNSANNAGFMGIVLRSAKQAIVENVYIYDTGLQFVYITSSDFCEIKDCFGESPATGKGIYCDASHYNRIVNNRFYDTPDTAILLSKSRCNKVIGNDLYNVYMGVEVNDYRDWGHVIKGNTIRVSDHTGISIGGGTQIIISGNHIEMTGSGFDGIKVTSDYNIITANFIKEANRYGVYISAANHCTFSNNIIYFSAQDGISVNGTDNTFTGNSVLYSGHHGIEVNNSSHRCKFYGNTVQNNGQVAVGSYYAFSLANSDYGIFIGNTCFDNQDSITSLLTGDAASGQPDVVVADASLFFEGQWVTISDDTPDTENNQILSIDTGTNTLTMVNNLANNYTVLQNAVVTGRKTQQYAVREVAAVDYWSYKDNYTIGNINVSSLLLTGDHSKAEHSVKSSILDLSGAATDIVTFHATCPCQLVGYDILYTEASSADAGVNVRIGRYQNGVALDDDYFDVSVSEISKNLGYSKHFDTSDLTNKAIAAGDTITVGTAGGKTGAGEVMIVLHIAEMAD